MKVQCPNCRKVLSVPDEYKGKAIRCNGCEKSLTATPLEDIEIVPAYRRPPADGPVSPTTNMPPHEPKESIIQTMIPPASGQRPSRPFLIGAFFSRLWQKSPTAFKTTFYGTLGIVSAIILTIYVYGRILTPRPKPNELAPIKAILAHNGLFEVSSLGHTGILRGRYLRKYEFSPDINRLEPYLRVWLDENDSVVGISTAWLGDRMGNPADIQGDKYEAALHSVVSRAFQALTGASITNLNDSKFIPEQNSDIFRQDLVKWKIIVERHESLKQGSENYNERCDRLGLDYAVYKFIASAQTW